MNNTVVLIPIYQPQLALLDQYSLDYSVARLAGRDVRFIGPRGLDLSYYECRYPGIGFIGHDAAFFSSVAGYSALLLSPDFYAGLAATHEFTLILQTDALLLRDDLDHWTTQPYDYLGAPWPEGLELFVNLDRFAGAHGRKVHTRVGNGGFSLRRNRACVRLLQEFPQAVDVFKAGGSSEDLFFAVMGMLSRDFVLPNEIVASTFAMELQPEAYFATNGGQLPMGTHAWWKYSPDFWVRHLGLQPPLQVQLPAGAGARLTTRISHHRLAAQAPA